MPKSSQ